MRFEKDFGSLTRLGEGDALVTEGIKTPRHSPKSTLQLFFSNLVEEFRGEVGVVRPDYRINVRIDRNLAEKIGIL